jgi:hypothetical protein
VGSEAHADSEDRYYNSEDRERVSQDGTSALPISFTESQQDEQWPSGELEGACEAHGEPRPDRFSAGREGKAQKK